MIVGLGPIGKAAEVILRSAGYTVIIIEENIDTVSKLDNKKFILFGDAAKATILNEVHLDEVNYLLITIPDLSKTLEIIHAARLIHPSISIIARIQYILDKPLMDELNVRCVCAEKEAVAAFSSLLRHQMT